MSKIKGVEVSEKDYDKYWHGKKEIKKEAKCEKCRGKEKVLKPCYLTAVGSGTMSNPREDIWLCEKHKDKGW